MATYKKFLVATDNHGSLICKKAEKKLLDFARDWKPHYRVHLGDNWDFAPLRGGASPEDKADGIAEDYTTGIEFLDAYKPHYLTLGNHCDRLWNIGRNAADGILRERCAELARRSEEEFRKRKIAWAPYHVRSFLKLPEGGPKFIHGFHSGVNPAKMHFEKYGSCIHGHVHAPNHYTARHIDGGEAFSIGCIGDIDKMSYADRYTAKLGWRQGWLYGIINTKTGRWNAWQVIEDNGDWISPMGIL